MWQPFVFIFTFLNVIAVIGGVYKDVLIAFIKTNNEMRFEDEYIKVKLDHLLKGPFFYCDKYNVPLIVANKTDAILILPHADIFFINTEVQKRIGGFPTLDHGAYHHVQMENPGKGILLSKESKIINIRGPDFIPRKIYFELTHSGSKGKFAAEIVTSREKDIKYWKEPKHIDFSAMEFGIDSLQAFQEALREANKFTKSCRLSLALIIKSITTRQANGLDIVQPEEWFFLFSNVNKENGVMVNYDGHRAKGRLTSKSINPEYADFLKSGTEKPILVGYKKALMIVDHSNLIYDNLCKPLWLDPIGLVNGEMHPVWCLPYVSNDYMQIHVDAYSGDILKFNIDYQQRGKGPPWKYDIVRR